MKDFRQFMKESKEWIGVDLDGTLAHYDGWKGEDTIGTPIPLMIKRVRRWIKEGKIVKIMTARADSKISVKAIKAWLKENGLPDLEITNVKDLHMSALWDDRAVRVQKNNGKRIK